MVGGLLSVSVLTAHPPHVCDGAHIQDINLPLQSHFLLWMTFHVPLPFLGPAVTATFSLYSFRRQILSEDSQCLSPEYETHLPEAMCHIARL